MCPSTRRAWWAATSSARETVESFQQFIEAHIDEITALQIIYSQPYSQRRVTDEQVADMRAKLQQYRPVDVLGEGQVATADGLHWTVADLRPALARWHGVTYQSDTSYRTLLKRCGYRYQRASKQFRSRSEDKLAEFEERLEKN